MIKYQKNSYPKKLKKLDYNQLSPIEVYKLVYTGKIKNFPNRTWNQPDSIEYAKEVFRYLIEEILKWSDEDIKNNFSVKTFIDYQLKGLLAELFNNSPFKVLDTVYPGRFKVWELKKIPNDFWTKDSVIQAMKWLIEEKLQWSEEDIKKNFTIKTFIENGLRRLFDCKLIDRSPYQAIQLVYPDRFKEWELPSTSHSFWTPETSVQAIKWLIEEKLQLSDEDIKKKLTVRVFSDNNLRGLLRCRFNDSPFQAIDAVYPGRFNRQDFRRFNGSSSFN
jgi:hypothetical protein